MEDYKHLYVPISISWEAQVDKAHKCVRDNSVKTAFVHNHGRREGCDQGGCIAITSDGTTTIETPVSERDDS